MMPSRPSSIDALTSIRGYAALYVVVYHYWDALVRLFPFAKHFSPLVIHGHLAVPCFFVLSGYVLAYNYADEFRSFSARAWVEFLYRRLGRIYPVHAFGLLVVLGMVVVSRLRGWDLAPEGYRAGTFAQNVFLVHAWVPRFHLNWNYPSWSISSEWLAYLLFPLVCLAVGRWVRSRLTLAIALATAWLGMLAIYVPGLGMPFWEMLCVLPCFVAGCLLREWIPQPERRSGVPAALPEVVCLTLAVAPFLSGRAGVSAVFLTGFIALVGAVARLGGRASLVWNGRGAVFLGEISYSLYMTHTLAQKMCWQLIPSERFASSGIGVRLGVVVMYLIAIAVWTFGTYYAVEKPAREWMRRRHPRRREATPPAGE